MPHVFLILMLVPPVGNLFAEGNVAIKTVDGGRRQGVIGIRTNDPELWLRTDNANAPLAASVRWQDIKFTTLDAEPIAVGQLLEQANAAVTARPAIDVILAPAEFDAYAWVEPSQPMAGSFRWPFHLAPQTSTTMPITTD